MNRCLFILVGVLFFQGSFAVIRVVGNGGGYAEMQAVLVASRMPQVLSICGNSGEACSLDKVEWSMVRTAIESAPTVVFSQECRKSPVEILDYRNIIISSCYLYQDNSNLAQDYSFIGSLVLSGHLMVQHNLDFESSYFIAKKVFRGFSQIDLSYSILTSRSELQFHYLRASNEHSAIFVVSAEGPLRSVDLTSYFTKNLSCGDVPVSDIEVLSFDSFQEIDESIVSADMRVRYSCGETENYQANATLFMGIETNGEVSEQGILVRFFGISRL